jgi:hypothetical protein
MRIQNTPGATSARILCSYWLIQEEVNLIGLAHFVVVLATSWRHQMLLYANSKRVGELLNAHSKYGGNGSILSCRGLQQHKQPS